MAMTSCTRLDTGEVDAFLVGQPVLDVHVHAGPDDPDQLSGGDARSLLDRTIDEFSTGRYGSMGELYYVFYGIPPTDERLEPYWALAEEFGIPVGVHAENGPPSLMREEGCCPRFDGAYGNPDLLVPVLDRHPRLKLYLMHFGSSDYKDAAIRLMSKYENVYCEISAVSMFAPKMFWQSAVKELFERGLGDRMMFGTDYEGSVRHNIETIYSFDWMTEAEKRAVLYDNAARFLGLDEVERARHHEMVGNVGR